MAQTMSFNVRPYEPAYDFEDAYTLWRDCFHPAWKLDRAQFWSLLSTCPIRIAAERESRLIGLAAAQVNPDQHNAALALLMVSALERRQGIGRALHAAALDALRAKGVRNIQLAGGHGPFLWPGVPRDMPGAAAFFRAQGWAINESSYDLVRSLRDYTTPPVVLHRIGDITIRLATPAEAEGILTLEAREFPYWEAYYRKAIDNGEFGDLLAALDGETVIGCLQLFTAESNVANVVWKSLLGVDTGGLGAVGVAEAYRGRGIGLALVARASEILRARGVDNSHIGWTSIVDFYGKLGYRVWREYGMAWRQYE
jgi:GNAT superfamily N-acetyltransferase